MKSVYVLLFLFSPLTFLRAQISSGNLFCSPYSFDFSNLKGSGGNNNDNSNWKSGNSDYRSAPTSSESITATYQEKAREKYNKGVKAWDKKDWNETIRFFKAAIAFDKNNTQYAKALNDARGYKEWDEGVNKAVKKNWANAIEKYKKSLEYFPGNTILKNNIIGCSNNESWELAEKYYKQKDYINAGVYYNVLWKNFGNNSNLVQSRYAECLSIISGMKKPELAQARFNTKLEQVKKELPYISNGW
ncbi:MAG TPA: hypothetical protein VET23_01260 [Chitinophagaceae bacterium]|nr:hypothetical protein [Chitinophagaceae bacterium]